jgi:hypothetical protein
MLHLKDNQLGAPVEAVAIRTTHSLVVAIFPTNHPDSTEAKGLVFPLLAMALPAIASPLAHCARSATNSVKLPLIVTPGMKTPTPVITQTRCRHISLLLQTP